MRAIFAIVWYFSQINMVFCILSSFRVWDIKLHDLEAAFCGDKLAVYFGRTTKKSIQMGTFNLLN